MARGIMDIMLRTVRRGTAVTSGTKSGSEPPPARGQRTCIAEELHCKRCGGAMVLARVLSGHETRFNLFRCLACDRYDRVKA
jgi:hypothetical protein